MVENGKRKVNKSLFGLPGLVTGVDQEGSLDLTAEVFNLDSQRLRFIWPLGVYGKAVKV